MQPPNQEHQSPQEVWIWKEENGKESKDVFFNTHFVHFFKVLKKTVQDSKSKILRTEEYMKGKIETICQICQIPKPFFEQKTDCVLLNAQLK